MIGLNYKMNEEYSIFDEVYKQIIMGKQKIGVVVQRYGLELNGGAEVHARILSEQLSRNYDVTVLTTSQIDLNPKTKNCYTKINENINGVNVLRFQTDYIDSKSSGKYLRRNTRYRNKKVSFSNFIYLPLLKWWYRKKKDHHKQFDVWMKGQGFYAPTLIDYLNNHADQYSCFIFFTYLFYPSYAGLKEVGYKSIFIPTAHDETPFYFEEMKNTFCYPKFIMYNAPAEKTLVEENYPLTRSIKSDIAGIGFDEPVFNYVPPQINDKYIVYIGRIHKGKGCAELIDFFTRFEKKFAGKIKLIMIGNNYMKKTVKSKSVIFTGFVSDDEKLSYLQDAEALIIPSPNESLSMVTLEAMIMGKPVLATRKSEVLKNHIENSQAGYTYRNEKEFIDKLNVILNLSDADKQKISANGISYVRENYNWLRILSKFTNAINYISKCQE